MSNEYASLLIRGNTKGIITRKYILDQSIADACNEFHAQGYELVSTTPAEWSLPTAGGISVVSAVILTFRRISR